MKHPSRKNHFRSNWNPEQENLLNMNNIFHVGTFQLMENSFFCFNFITAFPCALSDFSYLATRTKFLLQSINHIRWRHRDVSKENYVLPMQAFSSSSHSLMQAVSSLHFELHILDAVSQCCTHSGYSGWSWSIQVPITWLSRPANKNFATFGIINFSLGVENRIWNLFNSGYVLL